MKSKGILPGIILIGMGTYFLLKQIDIPFIQQFLTWPSLLLVLGLSFLVHGYIEEKQNLFTGVLLTGLGFHFHARDKIEVWVDHWAVYPFMVSIAYLVSYQKTKSGLIPGILLFCLSLLGFFYEGLIGWMGIVGSGVEWIVTFWPVALIIIGVYLLFKRKR